MNTYAYVGGNPLSNIDSLGLARKFGGKTGTRLANCPAGSAEKKLCKAQCANRGGVKTCKVTRATRPIIVGGYPTREPYTIPGSMNCVCNKPDGGGFCGGDACTAGTVLAGTAIILGRALAGCAILIFAN